MKRAVFFDRDGVINKTILSNGTFRPPRKVQEIEIIDGISEMAIDLRRMEFELVVVTNQPDISKGLTSREFVEQIHNKIRSFVDLRNFYVCEHTDEDGCLCRKPKPGLLIRAAQELSIDLSRSFLIGDRWRDIEAGNAVGCKCIFLDYKYPEKQPTQPFYRVTSILEAKHKILEICDNE